MSTVAAYTRVSDQRQVDRWSLAAQRRAIAEWCARAGHPEPAWYEEAGRSAHVEDFARRPAFARLLADIEAGRVRTVVVVDIDRFARKTLAALTAAALIERSGAVLVSLNQPGDFTTPDGRLRFTIHAGFAQYESEQRARRVRAGMAEARAQGRHIAHPPYGARLVDGRLALDPETAPVLAEILERAATESPSAIAAELTRRGVPRPSARRGPPPDTPRHHWWPDTIRRMILRGHWLLEQPDPWPARWRAARGRAPLPRARADRQVRMLTGLMRCPCGSPMQYNHGAAAPRRLNVVCHGLRRRGQVSGCPHPHTYADVYEERVTAQLLALRPRPAAPDPAAAGAVDPDALREEKRKLWVGFRAGALDEADFLAEIAALDARLAALAGGPGPAPDLAAEWPNVLAAWPTLAPPQRNAVLRELVEYVVCGGREARIVWRAGAVEAFDLPAR